MVIDDLLTYLFDGESHLLTPSMTAWLTSSRRFTAFTATFRNKIRKKVRATRDRERLLDLHLELETAYLLLQERRLSLTYEPQPCGQSRCPDLAVTFTTSVTFMIEVTRLQSGQGHTASPVQAQVQTTGLPDTAFTPISERLADTICSKLGQLLPQRSNVLLVGAATESLAQQDLNAVLLSVQQRAERNDSTLFQRHRFRDRSDLFRHYQRLSEIVVRGPDSHVGQSLVVWVNPQAKHPLPSKVRTVLYHNLAR